MALGQRGTAVATAGSLAVLLLSAPSPREALPTLADAGAATDPTAPLVAAVALLAWAVAGWLALTVLVVVLSRVPGLLGRAARALARRVAPATVRRAVEAALGITVAVGVVAPTAALAAPTTMPRTAASAEAAWDLDWPSGSATPSAPPPAATPAPATTSTPRPPAVTSPVTSPTDTSPTDTSPPLATVPQVPRTRSTGAAPPSAGRPSSAAPTGRPLPATPAVAAVVVVEAGDTLWSLAEASLRSTGSPTTDRQVAQAWPRWWAANRDVVGDDPDLLLPGTVLRPPAAPAG